MAIRLRLAASALLVFLFLVVLPSRLEAFASASDCEQTEYLAYRDCVHAANAARHKRQSAVVHPQHTANHTLPAAVAIAANISLPYLAANTTSGTFNTTRHCQRLNFDCRIECRNETLCESRCPVCPLNADQLPPPSADGGDFRTVVIERADGGFERFRARIEPGRNITTIIRLTNILNNTNHIHIPTNVTTNNVNNVNLHANHTMAGAASQTGGEFGLGYSEQGSCCYVVQPRQCRTSSTAGRRCHNQRKRQCDDRICKARVMLVQTRRRCSRGGADCKKRLVYVPEPGAPKCVRIPRWPFVVCGPVVSRAQSEALRHRLPPPPPPPMVPAWDPYYYGGSWPDYGGQYGQQPPQYHPRQPGAGHHGQHRDVYYEDEVVVDDDELGGADNGTESGEWLQEDAKCKVVSANGSVVEIRNCTAGGLDENEFATEPKVNFARDAEEADEEDEDFRPKRHAAYYEEEEERGVQQRSNHIRRRRHHRRPHLDHNYEDDDEDERYMQQLPNNRIAEDFEYDEELDHPYKRPNRRKGRRGGRGRRGRGRNGGRRHQKIVYDEEEEVGEQKGTAEK